MEEASWEIVVNEMMDVKHYFEEIKNEGVKWNELG
jgi:hypothetical protein